MLLLRSPGTLSPSSFNCLSAWYTRLSLCKRCTSLQGLQQSANGDCLVHVITWCQDNLFSPSLHIQKFWLLIFALIA
jgi:hypothetical protein